eukprot:6466215-Amphidinium_carterae.1
MDESKPFGCRMGESGQNTTKKRNIEGAVSEALGSTHYENATERMRIESAMQLSSNKNVALGREVWHASIQGAATLLPKRDAQSLTRFSRAQQGLEPAKLDTRRGLATKSSAGWCSMNIRQSGLLCGAQPSM